MANPMAVLAKVTAPFVWLLDTSSNLLLSALGTTPGNFALRGNLAPFQDLDVRARAADRARPDAARRAASRRRLIAGSGRERTPSRASVDLKRG